MVLSVTVCCRILNLKKCLTIFMFFNFLLFFFLLLLLRYGKVCDRWVVQWKGKKSIAHKEWENINNHNQTHTQTQWKEMLHWKALDSFFTNNKFLSKIKLLSVCEKMNLFLIWKYSHFRLYDNAILIHVFKSLETFEWKHTVHEIMYN